MSRSKNTTSIYSLQMTYANIILDDYISDSERVGKIIDLLPQIEGYLEVDLINCVFKFVPRDVHELISFTSSIIKMPTSISGRSDDKLLNAINQIVLEEQLAYKIIRAINTIPDKSYREFILLYYFKYTGLEEKAFNKVLRKMQISREKGLKIRDAAIKAFMSITINVFQNRKEKRYD